MHMIRLLITGSLLLVSGLLPLSMASSSLSRIEHRDRSGVVHPGSHPSPLAKPATASAAPGTLPFTPEPVSFAFAIERYSEADGRTSLQITPFFADSFLVDEEFSIDGHSLSYHDRQSLVPEPLAKTGNSPKEHAANILAAETARRPVSPPVSRADRTSEPFSLLLFGSGLFMLATYRRRKKHC